MPGPSSEPLVVSEAVRALFTAGADVYVKASDSKLPHIARLLSAPSAAPDGDVRVAWWYRREDFRDPPPFQGPAELFLAVCHEDDIPSASLMDVASVKQLIPPDVNQGGDAGSDDEAEAVPDDGAFYYRYFVKTMAPLEVTNPPKSVLWTSACVCGGPVNFEEMMLCSERSASNCEISKHKHCKKSRRKPFARLCRINHQSSSSNSIASGIQEFERADSVNSVSGVPVGSPTTTGRQESARSIASSVATSDAPWWTPHVSNLQSYVCNNCSARAKRNAAKSKGIPRVAAQSRAKAGSKAAKASGKLSAASVARQNGTKRTQQQQPKAARTHSSLTGHVSNLESDAVTLSPDLDGIGHHSAASQSTVQKRKRPAQTATKARRGGRGGSGKGTSGPRRPAIASASPMPLAVRSGSSLGEGTDLDMLLPFGEPPAEDRSYREDTHWRSEAAANGERTVLLGIQGDRGIDFGSESSPNELRPHMAGIGMMPPYGYDGSVPGYASHPQYMYGQSLRGPWGAEGPAVYATHDRPMVNPHNIVYAPQQHIDYLHGLTMDGHSHVVQHVDSSGKLVGYSHRLQPGMFPGLPCTSPSALASTSPSTDTVAPPSVSAHFGDRRSPPGAVLHPTSGAHMATTAGAAPSVVPVTPSAATSAPSQPPLSQVSQPGRTEAGYMQPASQPASMAAATAYGPAPAKPAVPPGRFASNQHGFAMVPPPSVPTGAPTFEYHMSQSMQYGAMGQQPPLTTASQLWQGHSDSYLMMSAPGSMQWHPHPTPAGVTANGFSHMSPPVIAASASAASARMSTALPVAVRPSPSGFSTATAGSASGTV